MSKKIRKPYTKIVYEDLTGKLYQGNSGQYTYLSPRWGYKRAYRHNQTLYIYLTSQLKEGGWIEIAHFKNANRLEILEYFTNFKQTSRRYKKAINELEVKSQISPAS